MSPRYAIYFAPEKLSPWWLFGAHWLGRDECTDSALPQPLLDSFEPDELAHLTAQPRRYGFHATLKAPFRLAGHRNEATLLSRLHTLAKTLAPVPLGSMRATRLSDFVALIPEVVTPELHDLATRCVINLDDLRGPPLPDDLRKRQLQKLDRREAELLASYGYPYVMERFRLHLTLTGPLKAAAAQCIEKIAASRIDHLNTLAPLTLDRLCLFLEKTPDAPFLRIADVLLQGVTK
jgi:putative phosphonate metabolism protein